MTTHITSFCPICKASVLCDIDATNTLYRHDAADGQGNWVRHGWRLAGVYAEKKSGFFIRARDEDSEDWRKGVPP